MRGWYQKMVNFTADDREFLDWLEDKFSDEFEEAQPDDDDDD